MLCCTHIYFPVYKIHVYGGDGNLRQKGADHLIPGGGGLRFFCEKKIVQQIMKKIVCSANNEKNSLFMK